MTTEVLLSAVGVVALAGFVQGLTGFGFGMVAMGLLPAVIGLGEAQAVATLTGIAACVTKTTISLEHVRWSNMSGLWLGTALGVPLGFMLQTSLDQNLVLRMLGLTICLLVMFEMLVSRRYAVRMPEWMGWGVGLFSGSLSGAFNVGGPPMVAYIYDRPWTKDEQVATLNGVFIASGLVRFGLLVFHDQLHADTWISAGWSVGPMLAAILCGSWILRFIPQKQLRAGTYLALLALGARYLILGKA
ncbi:MAG TPA: sulfite exporter TauE/SafE family protein [Pirellulales bacterium]|nr:sulfite exporter TauE/SafE family protein [Pirellulales bacterium]